MHALREAARARARQRPQHARRADDRRPCDRARAVQVWCVAWSASGKRLASCGGDKAVRIWGQDGGRWVCESILEDAHDRTVRAAAWSPGDDKLATASFDGTCVVWSCRDGEYEQVATLQGHENEVKSVAWDASGNLLATCSRDKSVWVWENVDGEDDYECVAVLHGHSQDVKMVGWHPSKEVLVSASYDDTVRTWEADEDDWSPAQIIDSHSSTVWSFAMDESGHRMATASDDTTIRFWRDAAAASSTKCNYQEEGVLRGFHSRAIYSIDWMRGRDILASAAGDDAVRVFTRTAATSSEAMGDKEGVSNGETAPAPTGGVSQPLEGKTAGWCLAAEQTQAHVGDVNCVRWRPGAGEALPNAPPMLASAGDDCSVKLWTFMPPSQPIT
eukprot:Tamp_17443.p1 GENE.Tamp_17443~~Tamp_17443.p1  ORF type:complete len:420 (+),score=64.35 Tamp_17443:98-1261(+)